MDRSEIERKVLGIFKNEGSELYIRDSDSKINLDSDLVEGLGLDSLDVMYLASELEEIFGFDEIPDEDVEFFLRRDREVRMVSGISAENFDSYASVRNVVGYVEQRLATQ